MSFIIDSRLYLYERRTGRLQMLELLCRMKAEEISESDINESMERAAKDPELLEEMLIRYHLK